MAKEVTGGLDQLDTEQEQAQTEDQGTLPPGIKPKGGLTIAGQKNVSLDPKQSQDIRDRLMQMIQEREDYAKGWGPIQERFAVAAGPGESFAAKLGAFNDTQNARQNDIMQMRMGIAQMDTDQQRQAQAIADKKAQDFQFFNMLKQSADAGAGLGPEPTAELYALYNKDPKAAITKLVDMRKEDSLSRDLRLAGLKPGSPEAIAFARVHTAGAGGYSPQEIRSVDAQGRYRTDQLTPLQMAGMPPAPAYTVPSNQAAPATTAASSVAAYPNPANRAVPVKNAAPAVPGAAPAVPGAAPAVPGAAPAVPGAAPAVPGAAPAVPSAASVGIGGSKIAPGGKEAFELALQAEKDKLELNKAAQRDKAEIAKTEQTDIAKNRALQQNLHAEQVNQASDNLMLAQRLTNNINKIPGVLGILNQEGVSKDIAKVFAQGISFGNMNVRIPAIADILVKNSPEAKKDPNLMATYREVASDMAQLELNYSKAVLTGQGAVSDNERTLIRNKVGDPALDFASSLRLKAKAVELEAKRAIEEEKLWNREFKSKGLSWDQFKDSKRYDQLKEFLFYDAANALGIKGAKYQRIR